MIATDPVLVESITSLRDGLRHCGFFPDLARMHPRIDALLQQVEAGFSASSRPFRIVLAGGTGVGKTTLLNALARSDIAPVGEVRPTTKGFTLYLHDEEHDPWAEELEHATIVRHQRALLRGKTLIDSPDADSSLVQNRRMLEEMVAVADLVLLVATQEKYVSESLLSLVRSYRHGRSFAFVFNKTDLCERMAVVDDYRAVLEGLGFQDQRIYAIAAKHVTTDSRRERDAATEEFHLLEEYIESELDQARIREIESRNIAERVTEVSNVVRAVLPEAWESAAEAWREHCVEVFSQFFSEMGSLMRRLVLQREALTDTITVVRGSSLAGLFGFMAEVVYALRRFRANGSNLVRLDDTENWVRVKTGLRLSETIARREEFAKEACCSSGMEFGLDPQALRDALGASLRNDPMPRGWFEDLLALQLRSQLREVSRSPGWWANILVNIVPWAWVVYWAYRLVNAPLSGEPAPWAAVPGAAVVLIALVLVEWSIVHRLLKWNARKRADALISSVLSGLETEFMRRRLPAVSRVTESVAVCTRRLRNALKAMERAAASFPDNAVSLSVTWRSSVPIHGLQNSQNHGPSR